MNCSTAAGAPASRNYYKKKNDTWPSTSHEGYLSDAQRSLPAMTRPRVPDDKRQRTARACDSCKRRKQKVSLQIISHFSFFWPPDTRTLSTLSFLLCTLRDTHHIYTHTHIHTHSPSTCTRERQAVSRLYSRYYALPHLSFRLLNVAICMSPPTCVQIPKCGQFMRETAKIVCSGCSKLPRAKRNLCGRAVCFVVALAAQHMCSPYMSVQCDRSFTSTLGSDAGARL